MDQFVQIAWYILVIGGAACVIMLFLLLIYVLGFLMKAKRFVSNMEQTYQQAIFMATLPVKNLGKWLWEESEKEGDDEDDMLLDEDNE